MIMEKKTVNLICSYLSLRWEMDDTTDVILAALGAMGFHRNSILRLLGKLDYIYQEAENADRPTDDVPEEEAPTPSDAPKRLIDDYVQRCREYGVSSADIESALKMMGYTQGDLLKLGLQTLVTEAKSEMFQYDADLMLDNFDAEKESDEPETYGEREEEDLDSDPASDAQPSLAYQFEDYTLEECPNCESEVVIRATGISRCPRCGKPILPCTKCHSCRTPCPYGYTGRYSDHLRPTNPPISQEEVEFYMSELEKRKESL